MRTIGAFIERNPALTYFVLTFAISWGAILAIIGPSGILASREEFERLFPIVLPLMVLGPSVSGILLTGILGRRRGMRDFQSRLLKWRVGVRWYAGAIFTAPLYFTAAMLALAAFSPEFLPGIFTTGDGKAPFLLRGIAVALVAAIVEELGWTGFAVPTLRRRYSPVATGLIVGILMVWVYDRTGSLLLAILMHMGLTASTLILQPIVLGTPLVTVGVVLAAAPWVIVAAVALIGHWAASILRRPICWARPSGPKRCFDRRLAS
jgi:membrane protease YdiL (CAAX protease family)